MWSRLDVACTCLCMDAQLHLLLLLRPTPSSPPIPLSPPHRYLPPSISASGSVSQLPSPAGLGARCQQCSHTAARQYCNTDAMCSPLAVNFNLKVSCSGWRISHGDVIAHRTPWRCAALFIRLHWRAEPIILVNSRYRVTVWARARIHFHRLPVVRIRQVLRRWQAIARELRLFHWVRQPASTSLRLFHPQICNMVHGAQRVKHRARSKLTWMLIMAQCIRIFQMVGWTTPTWTRICQFEWLIQAWGRLWRYGRLLVPYAAYLLGNRCELTFLPALWVFLMEFMFTLSS